MQQKYQYKAERKKNRLRFRPVHIMVQGIITEIQHGSYHDGPGLRTTVFMKGCPLHCAWCHNPEAISPKPQIMLYPEKCIGCGHCKDGCFAGARVLCGKKMTTIEVIEEILADKPYYGNEGGVTLSGGEPLMQADFSASVLAACQSEGVHTAVETSLSVPWESALKVLSHTQLVMADLKLWNTEAHKKYTGLGNECIIENIKKMDKLGIPIILRTPVMVEVNQKEIPNIASFASGLKNLLYYELLAYHPLGKAKAAALGISVPEYTAPGTSELAQMVKDLPVPTLVNGKKLN